VTKTLLDDARADRAADPRLQGEWCSANGCGGLFVAIVLVRHALA